MFFVPLVYLSQLPVEVNGIDPDVDLDFPFKVWYSS
jgi:hypothetical protein